MDQHIISVNFHIEQGTFSHDGSRYVIYFKRKFSSCFKKYLVIFPEVCKASNPTNSAGGIVPPKIRGGGRWFLVFENWTKRGDMKKLLRNRGFS